MNRLDIIKKLTEEAPQNSNSWYLLGTEYASINKLSEALNAFSEALKYCDDNLRNTILLEISKLSSSLIEATYTNVNEKEEIIKNPSNLDIKVTSEDIENPEVYSEQSSTPENNTYPFTIIEGGKTSSEKIINLPNDKVVTFNDVGGLDKVKETISMKIIKPFTHTGLFDRFKKKIGGGILLYGPPGCGKTFIAKATAGECNATLIPVHITDILSKFIGESEQNIADIFETARMQKPCVLFFDELDSIGYNRARLSSEHMRPVIDQFLTEIQGIDTNTDKLLIIGATNMPWDVDSAFKRPGRFDKTIFIPPPDLKARQAIFKLKLADKPVGNIDYEVLSNKTELYSGADIENVVEIATESVITEIMQTGLERPIEMRDLLSSIGNTHPSTIEWLRTIKNYVMYANQSGQYNDVSDYLNSVKKYLR